MLILSIQGLAQAKQNEKDTVRFPIKDRRVDFLNQPSNNPFDIRDTNLVKKKVEYDPATKTYQVGEYIGKRFLRNPNTLSFDECNLIHCKVS